ncbi:hypothetical protein R5R35_011177 [Gryllus longicercus]|uniref:G2/M phase-specific E3 ubiquitin-protein ligase n=1 Tax=Gryllus longicercus TaxID=2509291 RepID=A0AAN9VM58_9ORTH
MEVNVPSGSVCCFCLTTYEDEALYGKFYKIEEITTHYFCLLLSSKVQQRGSDNEGILGFLPMDIRNEVKRGKKLTCIYCGKRGATLSCHYSKCRSHFHLPCGRSRDTFHEFFGEFKSFCCRHRKTQRIKGDVLKAMSGKQSTCSICLESVPATPSPSTLWAPCCSKDAWFHRICIQRLALSAGYFFKCPLCNNTTRFIESMRTHGIWIPEQDAAWERDPERYEGLLQRHNSCDAKSCRCRHGRTHHVADTKWEIKLCAHCGSQGMHVQCGNLRLSQDWICSVCSNVSDTKEVRKTGKVSHSREAHLARNRDRRNLPLRPPQRVTRQRRPPEEEIEEREEEMSKEPLSVHSKSEISFSKTDKGASSTPQKDDSSRVISQSTEVSPAGRQPSPEEENSDVEILENSDDEIQILSTPNIRIIKTNSGISVPVMKVHASQPSGEDVVAAGEPCQAKSGPNQCASMGTEDDFDLLSVPSTSRIQNPSLQTVDEIIVGDEPLPSSQSEDDDDIIVEYEKKNSVSVICQTLDLPSRNTSSSENYTTAEASLQTNMPTKDTTQSKLDNTKEQNVDVTISFESIPSAQPELLDHNGPPTACETDVSVLTVCPTTREQSSQTHVPRREEFVETTELTNMFYDLSRAVHSASMVQQQQQQAAVSSLQPEMFMPTANVFQSVSPLAPNRTISTTTSTDSAAPGLSVSMQVDPATDMTAWRSKILNLVRGFPIDTQFTTSSSTAPNVSGISDELPTQVPLVSEGISMQSSDILPPNSLSSLASCNSRPQGTDCSSQRQISMGQAESSRMTSRQVLISLPDQPPQDDWSVEFGQVDANFIKDQQSLAEEQPDVVFERHPGSVPRGHIPWENHEESSSGSDEIIVVVDDQDDVGSNGGELKDKRKRKQKLVERCDYNQSFSASNPHRIGDPQRMDHFSATANGPGEHSPHPQSSAVTAVTGPGNIYIWVNPLLPAPLRPLKTSSQDFCNP